MRLTIPENLVPYHLLEPAADAAGRTTSAYVSLKNAVKAWIVFYCDQGNAATIAISPKQATDVAGTGTKAINASDIWAKLDSAALADFTKATAAASYTTDAGVKIKVVVFEIDPTRSLDVANDFDCIGLTTGASNAANITSAMLLLEPRHGGATVPSAIAD